MTKYARRTDANHAEIVAALKDAGALVEDLSAVGCGVPDILVGYIGASGKKFALFEIKDGAKAKSRQKLTMPQVEWHGKYSGWPVGIVDGPEAALQYLKLLQKG